MASEGSYTITLKNNRKEERALAYLCKTDSSFLRPSTEGRKQILDLLNIPKKYSRAFDLIQVHGHINSEDAITVADAKHVRLIELKTTEKYLPKLPKGFFFGATQNEFDLADRLGDQYAFCFVCLNDRSLGHTLISVPELDKLIVTKRVQYQINL